MSATVVELFQTKGWTKEAFASTREGASCSVYSVNAESFCLLGALRRVYGTLASAPEKQTKYCEMREKLSAVCVQKYGCLPSIPYVNDHILTSKEEAIELCKEAGI